jgi:hypothetical protein
MGTDGLAGNITNRVARVIALRPPSFPVNMANRFLSGLEVECTHCPIIFRVGVAGSTAFYNKTQYGVSFYNVS